MWNEDDFWDGYYEILNEHRKSVMVDSVAGLIAIAIGLGIGAYLVKKNEQDDYTIIVDENEVNVIPASKIEKEEEAMIIKLANGMEFEVPNDKQAYFVKDVKSEEDIEKYIYSIVGEDANISYMSEEEKDVKKKVRSIK